MMRMQTQTQKRTNITGNLIKGSTGLRLIMSLVSIMLLFSFAASVSAEGITITRDIPDSAYVNEPASIDLVVDVDESDKPGAYILKEFIPAGLEVVDTGGGNWDSENRFIKWLRINDFMGQVVEDITYTYQVKSTTADTFVMSGSVQTTETNYDVAGETDLVVQEQGQQDTEAPTVGSITPVTATTGQAQTYSVGVSDNTGVTACSLYVGGVNKGAMSVPSPCASCTATKVYTFGSSGTYSVHAECEDAAGNPASGVNVDVEVTDPPSDEEPPVISNINAVPTSTSATITWTTDENSDSAVEYGTTDSYGSAEDDSAMVTSHTIVITGLSPSTTYHYRVLSKDAFNNVGASGDLTFTTNVLTSDKISGARDLPAQAYQNVNFNVDIYIDVNETNKPNAYILRETIPEGFDIVNKGGGVFDVTTRVLRWMVIESAYLGTHVEDRTFTYTLKPTISEGTYPFVGTIEITDGIYSILGDQTLTVGSGGGDTTPPVISGVAVSDLTTTSATIGWNTDELADSFVEWGTTTAYGSSVSDPAYTTSHSLGLTGLTPNTLYHYRVESTDASSNTATSTDRTFITPAEEDTTPPVISNVQATGITATSATITWTTDEQADSAVDYGTTDSYGSTESDTAQVTSHSITLSNLDPDTTYHYRVESTDASSNTATSTDRTFTTASADTNYPISILNVKLLNNDFVEVSSVEAGSQFNIKVKVKNVNTVSKTPMTIVEVLDGTTPIHIGTIKYTLAVQAQAEITVGFVLPQSVSAGKTLTVKVLNWNQWISQGSGFEVMSDTYQMSFSVV